MWDKIVNKWKSRKVQNHAEQSNARQSTELLTMREVFAGGIAQALTLPAVNACIEIISDSIAKMPIYLMDGETRERVEGHPVIKLMTVRPTETMTAYDYHKLMEVRRIAEGNAYALIERDKWGTPIELTPIPPQYMTPMVKDGKLWYVGQNPKTGEYRKFWNPDILHYKAMSNDGIIGISYLARGAQIIDAALQAQRYEQGFYRNGARVSGILQTDADLTNKPDIQIEDGTQISIKEAIRREWDRMYAGADNAYKTAVLDYGLKYMPITASNRDAQYVETKAATIEDIARLFNIPLYKLGVGKQTYESNMQASIEYMQRTLSPVVTAREQEDTYKLLTQSEKDLGLQLRRNMMGELRGDWVARGQWFRAMTEIGVYSVDDIRSLEDLPNVSGGAHRRAPLGYVPLEDWAELATQRIQQDGRVQK